MADLAAEIRLLREEVATLSARIAELLEPSSEVLSTAEKSRILREAHASGDRTRIRQAHKLINGELSR